MEKITSYESTLKNFITEHDIKKHVEMMIQDNMRTQSMELCIRQFSTITLVAKMQPYYAIDLMNTSVRSNIAEIAQLYLRELEIIELESVTSDSDSDELDNTSVDESRPNCPGYVPAKRYSCKNIKNLEDLPTYSECIRLENKKCRKVLRRSDSVSSVSNVDISEHDQKVHMLASVFSTIPLRKIESILQLADGNTQIAYENLIKLKQSRCYTASRMIKRIIFPCRY